MKKIVFCVLLCVMLFSFSLLTLNFPSDNDNDSGEFSLPSVVDFTEKTYIAFGDSITFGADYSRNYAQMNDPYPKLVASILDMKSYKNAGVSSATLAAHATRPNITSNILSLTDNYDIISVLGGVNDYDNDLPLGKLGDTTYETIYGSLEMIANYLTTNFSDSYIFFMTPLKCNWWHYGHWSSNNSQGYNLENVVIAVKQVANKYSIPVLDLFSDGQFELEMYNASSDGLHPSQDFVTNYTAPQIAEFLRINYPGKAA